MTQTKSPRSNEGKEKKKGARVLSLYSPARHESIVMVEVSYAEY